MDANVTQCERTLAEQVSNLCRANEHLRKVCSRALTTVIGQRDHVVSPQHVQWASLAEALEEALR